MPSRKQLVEAAKDLNKVLDADPPIDVEKGVDEIKKEILEAAILLTDGDKIEDETRAVIDELQAPAETGEKAKPAKGKTAKAKDASAKATEEKKAGASPGSKIRMQDGDISAIVKKEMPKDLKEFSKGAADKMLKALRARDDFSCSRERFHPLFQKVLEARA